MSTGIFCAFIELRYQSFCLLPVVKSEPSETTSPHARLKANEKFHLLRHQVERWVNTRGDKF